MKHAGSIEIKRPIDLVTKLFADPKYLREYQDGFVKKELITGREGQKGAVSKLYYKYGKREMVLTETISANKLPESFEADYHHKHMDNWMKCTFIETSPTTTQYNYEYEYTRIDWFLPKLMAILFPGMYKKQGDKWMKQFKNFVEKF